MRVRILEELRDELPNKLDFDIGYYEKRSSKSWLVTPEDLKQMYVKFGIHSDIPLWCDADCGQVQIQKKGKRKREEPEGDEDCDGVYEELQEKHGDSYTMPQLRLWARMINCGTHASYESPPSLPPISGMQPKKTRKDSLTEVFADAASAFSKAMQPPGHSSDSSPPKVPPPCAGISPGKAVDLRSKNLQQLRSIQQLLEDKILTQEEYMEQKEIVLASLRKI